VKACWLPFDVGFETFRESASKQLCNNRGTRTHALKLRDYSLTMTMKMCERNARGRMRVRQIMATVRQEVETGMQPRHGLSSVLHVISAPARS
jgi:hypothetical protein